MQPSFDRSMDNQQIMSRLGETEMKTLPPQEETIDGKPKPFMPNMDSDHHTKITSMISESYFKQPGRIGKKIR